jgi:two-component sensor histidine kinase/AmiR/NasT family two-component response regulator
MKITAASAARGPDLSRPAPINVLIVDDEPKNLTVLEAILDRPDYRLVRAESGEQALLALLRDEFAVLILDIRMPGMTGFELVRLIKQRKNTANVPIILLTAYYNEDQHALEGYGAGAVDYLLKPVNPTILRSKVAVFAELYRKRRNVDQTNRVLQAEVASRRRAEDRLRELNDTLEQRVAERTEHISQLLKEMDHRSKNLLNVVQVIARQTAVANPGEFMARFSERIQTLAASHDLLVKNRWQGVGISDLIRVQLGHFSDLLDRRIRLDGPPFRLSVAAAQTLSMILHELATNAAKYGALSNDSGRVDIRWSVNGQFTLGWTECGGPNVVPPNRRGFGSIVVKAMPESNLDGEVDVDFAPAGLRWRVVCSASKVRDNSLAAPRRNGRRRPAANISGHRR